MATHIESVTLGGGFPRRGPADTQLWAAWYRSPESAKVGSPCGAHERILRELRPVAWYVASVKAAFPDKVKARKVKARTCCPHCGGKL
jgi:hypothetical protein